MIIHIDKHDDPYARIDKTPINDPLLSFRAKGVLVYLLSKPKDWEVHTEDIINHGKEGRDAIRVAMGELKNAGYAKLINTRNGKEWVVKECPSPQWIARFCPKITPENPEIKLPCPENPAMAMPSPEKPTPENPSLTKNDITNPPNPQRGNGYFLNGCPNCDQAMYIAGIFHRRMDTKWSAKEQKAFAANQPMDCYDLAVLTRYYSAFWGKTEGNYCRRDILTFINNYNGEIDRARQWIEESIKPKSKPVSDMPKCRRLQ